MQTNVEKISDNDEMKLDLLVVKKSTGEPIEATKALFNDKK